MAETFPGGGDAPFSGRSSFAMAETAFFLEPASLCLVKQMLNGEVEPGVLSSCESYAGFGRPCGRVGELDANVVPGDIQPRNVTIFDYGEGQCPTAPIGTHLE